MHVGIGHNNCAEIIGEDLQFGPVRQIGRSADGINAWRPSEGKLEGADRLSHSSQLDCQGILMNRNTLAALRKIRNAVGDFVVLDSIVAGAPATFEDLT